MPGLTLCKTISSSVSRWSSINWEILLLSAVMCSIRMYSCLNELNSGAFSPFGLLGYRQETSIHAFWL